MSADIIKEKPDALLAWSLLLAELVLTGFVYWLSLSSLWPVWLLGQMLVALSMLHWFVLMHDMGHGSFFRQQWLNMVFGHIASVFCLLPFYPWKYVHHSHHVWTGWKDKDPTHSQKELIDLSPAVIRTMNFCWKYWIPFFTLVFTASTFWNIRRINTLYPQRKRQWRNVASIVFMFSVYILAIILLQGLLLKIWLPAFLLFLLVADPILLSQHTHIDHHKTEGEKVRNFKFREQDIFTRTIVYPDWVSKLIFLHFDRHGLHHQYPNIPLYHLGRHDNPDVNKIYWKEWLKTAKRMPASVMIFQSSRDTGIKI